MPSDANKVIPSESVLLTAPRNKTTKRLFIAATRMNDGKTTTSLALFSALRSMTDKVGFIKPVGQRYVEYQGSQVDEDSVLLNRIFNVATPMQAMSPVVVHSSFTREFLDSPEQSHEALIDKICRAFDRAAFENDYIIVEGTGHAGVGSVFNLSNADVAKRLDAKVIIVARGGIGRPVDEIAINQALFERAGVEVIGAIINKVEPGRLEMIHNYCGAALERMGIPLLGCIPLEQKLLRPNLNQIVSEIKANWLNGKSDGSSERIDKVLIGAMGAREIIEYIRPGTLIVTPGEREDIIMAAIAAEGIAGKRILSGLVLTRNVLPHPKLMAMIAQTKIPVVTCRDESFEVATKIHEMTIKTTATDSEKISIIKDLITKNIDLNVIKSAFDDRKIQSI
jgi:BioD-like phosphotransacetylase family protein